MSTKKPGSETPKAFVRLYNDQVKKGYAVGDKVKLVVQGVVVENSEHKDRYGEGDGEVHKSQEFEIQKVMSCDGYEDEDGEKNDADKKASKAEVKKILNKLVQGAK